MPLAYRANELRVFAHARFEGVISSHTFHPGDNPETYIAVLDRLTEIRRRSPGMRGAMIVRAVGDRDTSEALKVGVFEREMKEEIPIVITTQEPQGTSSFRSNEQSKTEEERFNLIPAWDMSIETMVIKLRYLLAQGRSYEEIHTEFVKNYLGEINVRGA